MPGYAHGIALEASAVFRDLATIIGLILVGFVMGLIFHVKGCDDPTEQVAPIPKATATMHEYRHTPHAIPMQ
jgi:hypothetical protein